LDGAVNSGSYDAPTDTLSFTSVPPTPKVTAMLMKSGQTVSYFNFDDGYYEDGRLTSPLVLLQPNFYGDYRRFVPLPANTNLIIDFASEDPLTGNLIWYDKADVNTARTIVNHAIYASTKVVSGFSGFRCINRPAIEDLRIDAQNFGWNYPPFNFNGSGVGDYLMTNTVVHLSAGSQIWMHYNYNTVYSQARGVGESLTTMFYRIGNISEL
jgi:hypothetical protein